MFEWLKGVFGFSQESAEQLINMNMRVKLGRGGYGQVYLGDYKGIKVAVKKIELSQVKSNKREEDALMNLKHDNIVKLLHVENQGDHRYSTKYFKSTFKYLKDGQTFIGVTHWSCANVQWTNFSCRKNILKRTMNQHYQLQKRSSSNFSKD